MDAPPPPILRSRRTYRPPSSSPHQPRAARVRPRTHRAFPWRSVLYQISFGLFLVLIAAMLVGSAWSLGEQAWRTGGQRKWNIVFLAGTYLALAIVSIAHIWSRLLSIKKILRTMPKPYVPTKQIDLSKKVADHIVTEYSRTAVIAHISQATKGTQEGWGRPGTKWDNVHFRTHILNTLPVIRSALASQSKAPPLSMQALYDAADSIGDSGALRLFVNTYANFIERARFARREPTESDAAAVDKVVDVILLTLEIKRRREAPKRDGHG